MKQILILFLLISFGSCRNVSKSIKDNQIAIKFNIKNCQEPKIFYFLDNSATLLDSINTATPNKIVIPSNRPKKIYISTDKQIRSDRNNFNVFYFDKGENELYINCKQSIDSIKINGSVTNDEYKKLLERKYAVNKALTYNFKLVRFYSDILHTTNTDSIQSIINKLESEKEKLLIEHLKLELEYFKDRPNSYLAAEDLNMLITKSYATNYMDEIKFIYQNLTPKIKNTEEAKILHKRINAFYNSNIGEPVPEIGLKDISNNLISIKNFTGKYVLIDFWASWCAPCIRDIPFLKTLKKSNHSNLEVISISKDEDINAWESAISKYRMENFIHISTEQNHAKQFYLKYFVQAIPVKILVNPEGKIIGRWRGYNPNYHDEIEKLIKL